MANQEENNKIVIEKNGRGGKAVKMAVIALVIIAAVFGAKYVMNARDKKAVTAQAGTQESQAQAVIIGEVTRADIANAREYIGNVESIQNVDVKPQAAGEIKSVNFKEGSMVRAGQLLFKIDDSQYAATVELRRAQIAQAKADLEKASKYLTRVKAADKRSISATDLDTAETNVLACQAAVAQANASLKLAEIDLRHTNVTSPISGRIGKAFFTKGNYVSLSSGALASIMQVDPIRVTFSVPDKDYLDQLALFRKNGSPVYKTQLTLSNGQVIRASGIRDFEDNEINSKTGSIAMRVRYNNVNGLLVPGSLVRVSTQSVVHKFVNLVPQEAIVSDTKGSFVYKVASDNTAAVCRVTLGSEYGVLREVTDGLSVGEKIVTAGTQSLRPGAKVRPVSAQNNSTGTDAAQQAMQSDSSLAVSSGDTSKDTTKGN